MHKFTVITACKNSNPLINETINSILNQTALANKQVDLEYLIYDANSTDGTTELIKIYASDNPNISLFSELDNGLYDALSKGFKRATGDIICYLNAGDIFQTNCFEIITNCFNKHTDIKWLTSLNSVMHENSNSISQNLPFKFRREFLDKGIYGKYLPFIQQESTFWRKELLSLLDLNYLKTFQYAGDCYLWSAFSKEHQLYILNSATGVFKYHAGQLSSNREKYFSEYNQIFKNSINLSDYPKIFWDKLIWHAPNQIKSYLNPEILHTKEI